jgi:hypothetical protein
LFGVDLNFDFQIRGRVPDFYDRRPDRECGTDAVLASYGFCAVDKF